MDPELARKLREADPAEVGRRIRAARVAKGLKQSQLAEGKISVPYFSRMEAGDRRPDGPLLEHFANILGVAAYELIPGADAGEIERWTLSLLSAELALETGDGVEALEQADALLEFEGSLPTDLRRRAAYIRARCLEVAGQLDDSIIELERLLDSAEAATWTLQPLIALSRCHLSTGDAARAIEVGETGLGRLKEAGLDGGDDGIRLSVTVAYAYFRRGDVGHAVRLVRAAAERAEEVGSDEAQAAAYWNASIFESERGALAHAIGLARHALDLFGRGEDARNRARLRGELGLLLLRLDPPEYAEAQRHLKRARRELRTTSGSVADLASCDVGLAEASFHAGDLDASHEYATAAYDAAVGRAPATAASALAVLGRGAAASRDTEAAKAYYREAVNIMSGVGQDRNAAQLWLELGSDLDAIGDADAARDAYRRAAVASGLQLPATVIRERAPEAR